MELLAQIADPEIEPITLIKAIRQLGPVTEEPSFWSAIANDHGYSKDHPRRAVHQLFRRHVKSGMTLAELAGLLDGPSWLEDANVSLVTIVGGRLPVSWSAEDTIFLLPIFPELPDGYCAFWAVYVKVAGKIGRESIVDVLRGRPVEAAAAQAEILEIGYIPDESYLDDL